MRLHPKRILLFLALLFSLSAFGGMADTPTLAPTPAIRQSLIGAWRLVRIERLGPDGPITEPFYQAESDGLIVYDAAGWMSVQILGGHRPALDTPANRIAPSTDQSHQATKAALLDSYYAYFGTWHVDEAASTVTHQISGALYPDEIGMRYAQHVSFEGDRMIFSISDLKDGKLIVRRKIWQKAAP